MKPKIKQFILNEFGLKETREDDAIQLNQDLFVEKNLHSHIEVSLLKEKIRFLNEELEEYRKFVNSDRFVESKQTIAHLLGQLIIDSLKDPKKNLALPKDLAYIYSISLHRKQNKNTLSRVESYILNYILKKYKFDSFDLNLRNNASDCDCMMSDASLFDHISPKVKIALIDNKFNRFLLSLKPEDKLIILYTTAPYIGHQTLELRPNRLAKEYIKLGYKVIFFSFSRIPLDLELPEEYDGDLLQCYKDDLLDVLSKLGDGGIQDNTFICSSFPDLFAMTAIEKLKMLKGWRTVYEIRDDMEEFNRVGYSTWYSSQLEIKVAQLVDRVVTVSPRLAQKIKIMARLTDDGKIKVIQNAAPDTLIDKSAYLRNKDFFSLKTSSNKIGYIGHLTSSWFDWMLLISVARLHPEWEFEIIGHGAPKNLNLPENIHILGSKTHDEFLRISESWKVGLIPFIKSPLTSGVDPNKIYEYLAANLLVVTADMGSVNECPATFVYDDPSDFENKLIQAMDVQYNEELLQTISNYVNISRWSYRAKDMIDFIGVEL